MDLPELKPVNAQAVHIVLSVLNKAKEQLGSKIEFTSDNKTFLTPCPIITVPKLDPPIAINSEAFIRDAIENKWHLTKILKYHLKYVDSIIEECARTYRFEVIFSQPTPAYPIPQTTVHVFFFVKDYYYNCSEKDKADPPQVTFRIEGQNVDHDVRFSSLTPDRILLVLMMKMKLYRRIEEIGIF